MAENWDNGEKATEDGRDGAKVEREAKALEENEEDAEAKGQ